MGPSRSNTAACTIQIYEDSEDSETESSIPEAHNPLLSRSSSSRFTQNTKNDWRDSSKTDAVDVAEHEYEDGFGSVKDLEPARSHENSRVQSVEVEDKIGRQFSSATQIRTQGSNNGLDDPFTEEIDEFGRKNVRNWYIEASAECDIDEDESDYRDDAGAADTDCDEDSHPDAFNPSHCHGRIDVDSRHVSDISAMPEELPLPEAPSPPIWTQRGFRRATESPDSLSYSTRLLSSPQSHNVRHFSPSTSKDKDGRFVSSPLARKSPASALARNSSRAREGHMSSPSPPPLSAFTHSPRSARQRRLEAINRSLGDETILRQQQLRNTSNAATEVDGSTTPSKHPNPNKEYPLVLLHCSFSSLPIPYSPSVLRAVLPSKVRESLTLLKEKLGLTVLERGILIPHPGEDYELLEERILENLELKTPRVGKCGHFNGSRKPSVDVQDVGGPHLEMYRPTSDVSNSLDAKCETCSRPVVDHCRGCEGDDRRRWDIRVYASNGLMRAGAWSAAWREMEKVDVEIGVWLDEGIRTALEREAQAEVAHSGSLDDRFAYETPAEEAEGERHEDPGNAFGPHPSAYGKMESRSASTAACSRPASRHFQHQTAQHERLPLSTLLKNYVRHSVFQRTEVLWQILAVCLAIALFKQWPTSSINTFSSSLELEPNRHHPVSPAVVTPVQSLRSDNALLPLPASKISTSKSSPETDEKDLCKMSACTFAPTAAAEAGMTALPADLARILLSSATATIHEPAEPKFETSHAAETGTTADIFDGSEICDVAAETNAPLAGN